MEQSRLQHIVIAGGGTAGWMAAAMFARFFQRNPAATITLVESEDIPTVGVGEATVPQILDFIRRLGIDEIEFIRATHATYKLGIRFDGWAGEGSSFFHPFADFGVSLLGTPFRHHWTRLRKSGTAGPLDEYCLASRMAEHGTFALPTRSKSGSYAFNYAFHFDASLVAAYLRDWATARRVERVAGTIVAVERAPDGDVEGVTLDDGRTLTGDMFIDCSGFRGLLIEQALETGLEDWSHWLLCDRAIAVPCESRLAPAPYTRSLAVGAGWQWRIPLQHRVGNGQVYCSEYVTDEQALAQLLANVEGPLLGQPRQLRFTAGMRRKIWSHNVFSLGQASGFLEPLESTSIYLVQKGLSALLASFPTREALPAIRDVVNAEQRAHWEHVRDFIILHYALNRRHGEPFWDRCRTMDLPDTLATQIERFRSAGVLPADPTDFFRDSSWLALFSGLGELAGWHHPAADDHDAEALNAELSNMAAAMDSAARTAPLHADFIARNCAIAERV